MPIKMGYFTLDKRGRTTLPKEIREHMGVNIGDKITFLKKTERLL